MSSRDEPLTLGDVRRIARATAALDEDGDEFTTVFVGVDRQFRHEFWRTFDGGARAAVPDDADLLVAALAATAVPRRLCVCAGATPREFAARLAGACFCQLSVNPGRGWTPGQEPGPDQEPPDWSDFYVAALERGQWLVNVDFTDLVVPAASAPSVARALRSAPALRVVRIVYADGTLGDEFAAALADSVRALPHLETLTVFGLCLAGVRAVARALTERPGSLLHVHFGDVDTVAPAEPGDVAAAAAELAALVAAAPRLEHVAYTTRHHLANVDAHAPIGAAVVAAVRSSSASVVGVHLGPAHLAYGPNEWAVVKRPQTISAAIGAAYARRRLLVLESAGVRRKGDRRRTPAAAFVAGDGDCSLGHRVAGFLL